MKLWDIKTINWIKYIYWTDRNSKICLIPYEVKESNFWRLQFNKHKVWDKILVKDSNDKFSNWLVWLYNNEVRFTIEPKWVF